jgi:hypothetical protein
MEPWDPEPSALAAGRAHLGAGARSRRNRVTLGDHQLRLGRDGRWYPFGRRANGTWEPDGPPIGDPVVDGDVTDGDVTDGDVTDGDVTPAAG